VALIERGASYDPATGRRVGAGIGGTCVNVGCVPKKLMFNAALHREMMFGSGSTMKSYGFDIPKSADKFDWAGHHAKTQEYLTRLNGNYDRNWKKAGIEVVLGTASFTDSNTVTVAPQAGATGADAATRVLKGKHILIACGGEPTLPNIPGIEHAINSDGFFDLKEQPKKVAVIGAGYIAVEMGGIFHGLGTETHLFFRGETVLRRGFDPYIVETLMNEMTAHGPELHKLSSPKEIIKQADGSMTLVTADGKSHNGFDCILSATGRKPVTDILNLGAAGVETNKQGFIKVDKFENTTSPNICAIGDATTTGYELTPVAIAAGRRLGDRLFGGEPDARILYSEIATVVFSHPPIGTIGLTEPAAVEEFGQDNIKVKQARFPSMLYAFNEQDHKVKTALKLVLKGPEELVVGLHCIGPFSDEMLQGFAVAVKMGATLNDFEAAVAIHPTVAEEMVTFGGWGQKKDADGVASPRLPPYLLPKEPKPEVSSSTGFCLKSAVIGGLAVFALFAFRSKL